MRNGRNDHRVDLGRPDARAVQRLAAAAIDIIWMVSSAEAQRRSMIPDRVRIHSSEESIIVQISALSTTRRGRYPPKPRMAEYFLQQSP